VRGEAYTGFGWEKPEVKRALRKPSRRWENNIKIGLHELCFGGMDWYDLVQDRDRWWTLVNAVMNVWVPYNAGNLLTSLKPVSFSSRTLLLGVSK